MSNRTRRGVLYGFLTLLFVVFVVFSSDSFTGAARGVEVSVTVLLPTMFPFFVFSELFVSTGFAAAVGRKAEPFFEKVFCLPGVCAPAFFLGLVCGFPVGAKTACLMYTQGLCGREDAERTAALCSNPSLAFVVSTVGGGFFGNTAVGWLLWGIQTLCSVLLGVVSGHIKRKDGEKAYAAPKSSEPERFVTLFCRALGDGLKSAVSVCASVVFFFALLGIVEKTGIFSFLPSGGLLRGFIEMINGVQSLAAEGLLKLPFISGVLGWSGLCVYVQLASVMTKSGCGMKRVVLTKAVQGVLSAGITYAAMPVVGSCSVFGEIGTGRGVVVTSFCALLFSASVILLFCAETLPKNLDGKQKICYNVISKIRKCLKR